ncbi:reverse transcriptase domain-containing protein [Bacteroides sp. 224]|uniref:reverse transcriptase domain-containing protein n=1 Tax=Bacteroides sp. 224 TaxID=2302936 RepID=UPI0013D5CEE8|nr:reverse transcriptase domain-containing protein [Bacteroides sp. 224]NDV66414.1 Retron-type reverse transcriptase [Bacteroides sp. 224]
MSNEGSTLLNDLFVAYYDARKNKRNTINQLRFEMNLEHNLLELYRHIKARTYKPKQSIAFIVTKPVTREVFAADFSDRVVHHLIHNYVNPIFERIFIEDSYSCRKGKGTSYGVKRLEHHVKSCSQNYTRDCYILKLDIQSYFMSIDRKILHEIIKSILSKYAERKDANGVMWKDKFDYDTVLYLIDIVVNQDPTSNYIMKGDPTGWEGLPLGKSLFHAPPHRGLPIGNLTSQLFSNVYLNGFDHYIKRTLGFKHYGRYVDDFYIIHEDKEVLRKAIKQISDYLQEHLKLNVHPKKIYLQHYTKGALFVGAYVRPYRMYVNHRIKKNFKSRMYQLKDHGNNPVKVRDSVNSYLGVMAHYRSFKIRREIMKQHAWVFKYGYVQDCCSVFRLNSY